MKRYLFTTLLAVTFQFIATTSSSAQKKDRREGVYSAYLYFVETPNDHNVDSLTSIYEDDLIKIDWEYSSTQINFELRNKSDRTLKIIWDDAAYISISGESSRIFHKGIKYTDRENSQLPTSIYKNASISDLIAPTSYSKFVSGQYGGWRSSPLIPISQPEFSFSTKIEYVPALLGQTMRVVLPIKVEDKVIEYIFSFRTDFIEKKRK